MFYKEPAYFEEIEHTADIGLSVCGNTVAHLFANAAFGFYHLLTEDKEFTKDQRETIELYALNLNDLMVDWLSELNYLLSVSHFVAAAVDTLVIDSNQVPVSLKAKLSGQADATIKHCLKFEIKAITYHQLRIVETKNGYKCRIFFDI